MQTGIIILAAGNSSRLGKPKQLLEYEGKTLLELVTQSAVETNFHPIVIVLGAYAGEISKKHKHPAASYIINDSWQKGMSSSISTGLSELLEIAPSVENIVITVADQVFITSEILKQLVGMQQETGKNIVASKYAKTTGTPTLFNKRYFDELIFLEGNTGAKHILQKYIDDVATVNFELGHIDIDTETDYTNLIKSK